MLSSIIHKTTHITKIIHQNQRLLSTTIVNCLNQKWRQERGLPLNPNSYGPLTDKPDYTFLDGRPTPLGMRAKKRLNKQKHIAMRVLQLSKEMDFAVERHNKMLQTQEENKQRILDGKLKAKGHLLLKQNNSSNSI